MEDLSKTPEGALVAKMLSDIERVGWTAIGVFDPDGNDPPFTYTIGLGVSYGHPELITFGLPPETAHGVLATAIDKIKEGRDFSSELQTDITEIIANDFTCQFVEMTDTETNKFMLQAVKFYEMLEQSELFGSLQLVWPDENNKYPWDKDCNPNIAQAQPLVTITK